MYGAVKGQCREYHSITIAPPLLSSQICVTRHLLTPRSRGGVASSIVSSNLPRKPYSLPHSPYCVGTGGDGMWLVRGSHRPMGDEFNTFNAPF